MKVGYSYWGFLGDEKCNNSGEIISTPDGNAFYSWSIIDALNKLGHNVVSIMPDRDIFGWTKYGEDLFSSWCKDDRVNAYRKMKKTQYASYCKDDILHSFDEYIKDLDLVLIEWRWEITGRNDEVTECFYNQGDRELNWQPDFKIQKMLIEYCNNNNIPFVVFDLDYKLTKQDILDYNIKYIIELGTKWQKENLKDCRCKQVQIPFSVSHLSDISVNSNTKKSIVYIGNRYERDWCIDKYIPQSKKYHIDIMVYGNWKESGRDSETRWPNITFGDRLQTSDMKEVYGKYTATILLAKREYCEYGFMTARLLEAVFYGVVPFFIEEFGADIIEKYAGKYAKFLTIHSKIELQEKLKKLCDYNCLVKRMILSYLREHLQFMDAKIFVKDMLKLVGKE